LASGYSLESATAVREKYWEELEKIELEEKKLEADLAKIRDENCSFSITMRRRPLIT
jgi:hypothetical protein